MSGQWDNLLPTTLDIDGSEYEIRSDYRAILDILCALSDVELNQQEKGVAALEIFYPKAETIPPESYQKAIEQCFWFINCGDEQREDRPSPKLVDWSQDFKYIVAPINRVSGQEVRAVEYMHWWTFVAAYYEIGDCTFAQIVKIRERKANGKSLDKSDAEWYRKNRQMVDFKTNYTEQDNTLLTKWGAG